MAFQGYYKSGDKIVGPLSVAELRQRVADGTIGPQTLVRKGQTGKWIPARKIKGFAELMVTPHPLEDALSEGHHGDPVVNTGSAPSAGPDNASSTSEGRAIVCAQEGTSGEVNPRGVLTPAENGVHIAGAGCVTCIVGFFVAAVWGAPWLFWVGVAIILLGMVICGMDPEVQKAEIERKRTEAEEKRARDSKIVCPHCRERGHVTTRPVRLKKGISGAKVTAAVITGGFSLLGTGLARKEDVTEATCSNCGSLWHIG